MHLVMLETNGNQRFVFTSPRQRENIGASYLLTMLAPWTLAAAQDLGIDATPVSVSSGKIILTVPDEPSARRLIGAVTRQVLALAPGMDVSGVFKEITSLTEDELRDIHVVANRYNLARPPAEARFAQIPYLVRADDSSLPAAPASRILGGMPPEGRAYSLPSQVKRACSQRARNRLVAQARESTSFRHDDEFIERLAKSLKTLEDAFDPDPLTQGAGDAPGEDAATTRPAIDLSKIAVIHIDGNGVGAIMRDIKASMDSIPADDLDTVLSPPLPRSTGTGGAVPPGGPDAPPSEPERLRRFLLAVNERLDYVVRESFFRAWREIAQWWALEQEGRPGREDVQEGGPLLTGVIPVVPILLGGDDLTVLTEGRYALPFMASYLTAYEKLTSQDTILRHLSPRARRDGVPTPMTAAAGAAVVPRPFPFHLAYTLAERLVAEAKKVGKAERQECSTLTYHALFDSTVADAGELLKGYEAFTARPYRLDATVAGTSAPDAGDDHATALPPHPGPQAPSGPASPDALPEPAASRSVEPDLVEPDLRGTSWAHMCDLSRRFRGLGAYAGDGPAPADAPGAGPDAAATSFPKTRAARIRKLLSDRAAAPDRQEELTGRIADEWADARRVLDEDLVDTIGDPRYVFDLIELTDLLPASYLTGADSARPAAAPGAGRERTTSATAQEDQ
ncbi:hypothetical protein [Actinomyces sp. oral taxon 897]|uniref:hypothetical protein n=1 Tax=Actinomyces sp. oral taxon 897 TaxID=2081702 RepID=UPI000D044090|nr:hypothetical protein [Actinomyces sp. oral taxon 897]AVM62579.1 hypothetical protein C3V41_11760 [Actinomyces sp. oral taxon 897]